MEIASTAQIINIFMIRIDATVFDTFI